MTYASVPAAPYFFTSSMERLPYVLGSKTSKDFDSDSLTYINGSEVSDSGWPWLENPSFNPISLTDCFSDIAFLRALSFSACPDVRLGWITPEHKLPRQSFPEIYLSWFWQGFRTLNSLGRKDWIYAELNSTGAILDNFRNANPSKQWSLIGG